jgi:polyphosphate glucokinase
MAETDDKNRRGKKHEREVSASNSRRPAPTRRMNAAVKSPIRKMASRGQLARTVLVIDVGGTSVKILATGQTESRSFRSGPKLTPRLMVSGVGKLAADWTYDVISIGYPGPVLGGRPAAEPVNLGRGWVAFDFAQAFGLPAKVLNDAVLQALGSYKGGKMLFLDLGPGLGTALVVNGVVKPMELGHLPYMKGTYEDYVGRTGLERDGKTMWRRRVVDVVERLMAAMRPDETVIGGGNVKNLDALPRRCRAGENANAFRGGFRLWAGTDVLPSNLQRRGARSRRKS